ncbi:uncharacterized protein LOC130139507 [Syzygium oleosum]|uniref:uncharacterized protein LOC130139507 n=1 Tax=Syzygium oleosum TaxID=219896 RepID=UPI0024B917D8|nr:uncharacterized protein LOC130139507 [Syzygium oleosum]
MGRQTQERNATVAAAVEAAVAAANGANGNNRNIENQRDHGNPASGPANVIRPMSKLVDQFLKLNPPKFDGKGDPEAAPHWVEELEKAFEVLGCTEPERVTLAVYQLQDNANDWWKATRERERKLAEFMRLRQGQMTVDQYEAEFARLSKFAPRMVENPQDKVQRFRDGLKSDLRSQMISLNIRGYGEMYERAQAIERDQMERAAASGSRFDQSKDNRRFGKKPMAGNRRFVPPARKNIGKPNHQQNRFGAYFKCGS